MRLHQLRYGFANNSSSSHSIVFLPAHSFTTDLSGVYYDEYGWGQFVLADAASKREYLQAMLGAFYQRFVPFDPDVDYDTRDARVAALYQAQHGGPRPEMGIDHQSVIAFPHERLDPQKVDLRFVRAVEAFLDRADVVVLGGNDNTDLDPYEDLLESAWHLRVPKDDKPTWICRPETPTAWTLFNHARGTRMLVDFDPNAAPLSKLTRPALVDLKITDACPYGCAYCYMGSTPKGAPADLGYLREVIAELGRLEVFEVAIGGGEPTLYPHFVDVLQALRAEGITPNVTTRNLTLLQQPDTIALLGSIAFSVESVADVTRFSDALGESDDLRGRCAVQLVLGVVPQETFEAIALEAKRCRLQLTLLGYKTTGRGADVTPYPVDGWWTFLANAPLGRLPWLAIDTVLAAQWEPQLIAAGIPRYLYQTQDGQSSMYIDGVTRQCAPSSYTDERFPCIPSAIQGLFQSW